jgi:hypothetical protein
MLKKKYKKKYHTDTCATSYGFEMNVTPNARHEDTELKEKRRIIEEDVVPEIIYLTII